VRKTYSAIVLTCFLVIGLGFAILLGPYVLVALLHSC
jgi:hypothetical protein